MAASGVPAGTDTLPKIFLASVKRGGDRTAHIYYKDGRWVEGTWKEFGDAVDAVARGLIELGVEPKRTVNILSASRREWVICDQAILATGAITVPIYPSNLPDQVEYIINNCEAQFIILENADQLAKVRASSTSIRKIVIIDGPGDGKEDIIT
ncbi:MAG: AMP-binding protein, partial [Myxococcales bacterium]|nr:AMP-binding protein [Myxococcales bacterium]